jgi:hypothetical protein
VRAEILEEPATPLALLASVNIRKPFKQANNPAALALRTRTIRIWSIHRYESILMATSEFVGTQSYRPFSLYTVWSLSSSR